MTSRVLAPLATALLLTASASAQDAQEMEVRWSSDPSSRTFASEFRCDLVTRLPGGFRLEPLDLASRGNGLARVLDEQRSVGTDGSIEVRTTIVLRAISPNSFDLPAFRRTAVDASGRSVSAVASPIRLPVRSVLPETEQTDQGPGPIEHLVVPTNLPRPLSQRVRDLALWIGSTLLVLSLARWLGILLPRLRPRPLLLDVARQRLSELQETGDPRHALEQGSRILREYFDQRHGTHTSSAATGRALADLPTALADSESAKQLDQLLRRSDAVKFPRISAAEDLETWLRDAEQFLGTDAALEQGKTRVAPEAATP